MESTNKEIEKLITTTTERYQKIVEEVKEEVYNLLVGEDYTPEKFQEVVDSQRKLNAEELFTMFEDDEVDKSMEFIVKGYSVFGKGFISKVLEEQPERSNVLFEIVVQQVLDLNLAINQFQADLEARLLNQQENIHNDKVEEE